MNTYLKIYFSLMLLAATFISGCGGDSDPAPALPGEVKNADLIITTRIDDTTGFLVAVDTQKDTQINNAAGIEVSPVVGAFTHNGFIYTTGSLAGDKVVKYSYNGIKFTKEAELNTGEKTLPTSLIFVDNEKAYLILQTAGELLELNLVNLTITQRIDLSAYALGTGDTSPEPSSGVIRGGKLFLALAQIDSMQTVQCQAGASVLIIDVASNTVEKHIQDNRSCGSGEITPNKGLYLDSNGDIYISNLAGYGFNPGKKSGYLRILNGTDVFDPGYFFSIPDLHIPGVPGNNATYSYRDSYTANGIVYSNLFIPGLSSNPVDYVNDKNYLAYILDLRQQTATPLQVGATTGWSADTVAYSGSGGGAYFGRVTAAGVGLYHYDPALGTTLTDSPNIKVEGSPVWIVNYKR